MLCYVMCEKINKNVDNKKKDFILLEFCAVSKS